MQMAEAVGALFSSSARAEPYPYYAALHAHPSALPLGDGVLVTSYTGCARALRDPRLHAQDERWMDSRGTGWRKSPALVSITRSMLSTNSPDHERVRRLVSGVFTPRRVAGLGPAIEQLAAALLDGIAERAATAPVDFVTEFAYVLPMTVLGTLLGVPEEDWRWLRGPASEVGAVELLEGPLAAETMARADAASLELDSYLTALIAERRAHPRDDLISALVHVNAENNEQLTEDELMANLALLLLAGFETTTNLLGNGLRILLERPDHLIRLRNTPELAAAYVEEMLRFDGPVQFTVRMAAEDLQIDGVPVSAGGQVLLLLGAANRDPKRFAAPDRFDPDRPDNQPLSFGGGPHFCIGAALARLEAQLALPMVLRRLPGLALAGTPVRWDRFNLRGHEHLPIRVARPAPSTGRAARGRDTPLG